VEIAFQAPARRIRSLDDPRPRRLDLGPARGLALQPPLQRSRLVPCGDVDRGAVQIRRAVDRERLARG
jgi:hypothetical protein